MVLSVRFERVVDELLKAVCPRTETALRESVELPFAGHQLRMSTVLSIRLGCRAGPILAEASEPQGRPTTSFIWCFQ